ncbi:MAG TPA: lamin tail domain-containing protein, partial [Candidatus Saccharimonadales bacterium]|nr:lamin tail domain-containing protein [Candidatus Saccharimonadales bacterium]
MNICKVPVLVLFLAGAVPVLADSVIFNEIMYHSTPAAPEQNSLEWVELFNRSTNVINLSGWRFSKGVKFAFPNVNLPAGGYIIVAANTNAFSTRYPGVPNVTGNWLGVLSNNGDDLELQRPDGTVEDSVSYASEGDWAIRQRGPLDIGH